MRAPFVGLLVLPLLLVACDRPEPEPPPPFVIEPVAFDELTGWREDAVGEAVTALRRSCAPILRRDPEGAFGNDSRAGTNADWQAICRAADDLGALIDPSAGGNIDDAAARDFFETWFQPYRVTGETGVEGVFTGYFEPLLEGSFDPIEGGVPLRAAPDDIISADLGLFSADFAGERVRGRLVGDRLEPYFSRGEIERGALDGRGLELVWVDDPIDKFFLQIQGSGLVRLADGRLFRVGYADQNGRVYRAIGRDLIELGELSREEVSLQTIDAWLRANPNRAEAIMDKNPSYVFFRLLGEADALEGPLGAQGVPLQPRRSLAVDRRYLPYGAPVWLETTAPLPDGERRFERLMIAQDTGGAIRGGVRGDVFWGAGDLAEFVAGHMNSRGSYYLMLPRAAVPTS